MSYYKPMSFNFTDHGLQRCRERLDGMKGKDEYEVRAAVKDLVRASTKSFETATDAYISAGNSDWYFVFKKQDNLLVTYTRVSPEKQLEIEMKGYYD